MDRRISGGLVLVVALVGALVVPQLINPHVVDGRAAIAPPAPPPLVGDCIRDTVDHTSYGPDGTFLDDVVFVPCSEPHRAEVISVELARQPASPAAGQTFGSAGNPFGGPVRTDLDYLGLGPDLQHGWEPTLDVTLGTLGPNPRQSAGGQRWAACTLGVAGFGVLAEPLQGALTRNGPPPAVAMCFTGDDMEPMRRRALCTGPHTAELFGRWTLSVGDATDQDTLQRSCAELVSSTVGRPIDTEPGLAVTTPTYAYGADFAEVRADAPLSTTDEGGWTECGVRSFDDRRLQASLRRLGAGPVPWAS